MKRDKPTTTRGWRQGRNFFQGSESLLPASVDEVRVTIALSKLMSLWFDGLQFKQFKAELWIGAVRAEEDPVDANLFAW